MCVYVHYFNDWGMLWDWAGVEGGKLLTYASETIQSSLPFCFNHVNTFLSTSHAGIHEWAISNVLRALCDKFSFSFTKRMKRALKLSFEAEVFYSVFKSWEENFCFWLRVNREKKKSLKRKKSTKIYFKSLKATCWR